MPESEMRIGFWGAVWRFLMLAAVVAGVFDVLLLLHRISEAQTAARTVLGQAVVAQVGQTRLLTTVLTWVVIVGVLYVACRLTPARQRPARRSR